MKAKIGSTAHLKDAGMIFEPKLDGIRAVCYVNKTVKLYSRNQRDITAEYPEFDFRKFVKAKSAILDGEIVVLDPELAPRFSLWQKGLEAHYFVFDILMLNGKDLTQLPLMERKAILNEVVTNGDALEQCVYTTQGEALWKEMLARSMEGVMAKQAESLYYPDERSSVWLKIKAYKTLEAMIVGYTTGHRTIASLVLGIYDKKKLIYIGKVGTGFSEKFMAELLPRLQKIELAAGHHDVQNVPRADQHAHWVKPELICEIKYLEFTDAKRIRAPAFIRLRPDKNPNEITFKEQSIKL